MRKINFKKLLRSPVAIAVLLLVAWPFFWMAASAMTIASYSAGLSNHLGATRGYFISNKLSNFVSFPDRMNLAYGYGTRHFWVSEGTEFYLKYSAVNYGEETVLFVIADYNAGLKSSDEFESVKVETSGTGILNYRAKKSGFYKISIIPQALVPAGDHVNYSYSMSWGTRS